MNAAATDKQENWLAEFRREFAECWRLMPDKGIFLGLFTAWLALFHFLGNSTLGYTHTPSLFGWLKFIFTTSVDEQHGKFVPLVVLGLFWWKRKILLAAPKQIWWPALGLVAASLLLHLVGFMVQQTRISVVAFFAGLYGLTGLVWGWQWMKASLFPFFIFAFCVPVAAALEPVTLPLRLLVAKISSSLALMLGVDVRCEGTQLFDPFRTFNYDVAPACSGIRSLTAILALATIYAFVSFGKKWERLVLVASALPLAILANVFRMLTIIVAAELFGQGAGNYVHEGGPLGILKLLPYAPAILGLLFIGRWLDRRKKIPDPTSGVSAT